ncbi:MAG: cadmium-translocating P-type ATPase [Ignavibacteria bacterium]|nr:cadmium-translocating P-type ATPase [Ignavibacteria bacterium]MCU7504570.1 cadmium-translocating P-type ATPase [Ignavibacteria bacterium]MCU7516592.1 cadmium-translocating P-type ATPase [Ignavibacteria bacterium]
MPDRDHNRHNMRQEHSHMEMGLSKTHAEHAGRQGHEGMIEDFKRRFWVSLLLTIPVLILSPMIQLFLGLDNSLRFRGDILVLFALSSIIYFYGGFPFLKGIYEELRLKKKPGMMTLIAIAITTAYIYSSIVAFGLRGEIFFWELATLLDIMLIGHWIEMRSVMSASRALEELAKLLPSTAHRVMDDGTLRDIELEELKVNDKILIKPGEKVPADGDILEGRTFINESMLTGESKPVSKQPGGEVIGGSLNGEGSVTVRIKRLGKDSFLSQVIGLVEEAQKSKSRTQNLADRAAFLLTVVAIAGGIITFFLWNLLSSYDTAFALERTVTVMVIACPHALGLAVPLVVAVSTSIAAGNGFLIRDRTAFEKARNVTAIVFDKTGTLTEGNFGVTDIVNFSGDLNDEDILKYAASVEANSQHPIAKGIVGSAKETFKVENFNSITGKGIEGSVSGRTIKVVSPGYLAESSIAYDTDKISKIQAQGKTVVFVLIDNHPAGAIALGDRVRNESIEAVKKLKDVGIKVYMLTGDNTQTAKFVSDELGLDDFIAEVLPSEKSGKIKEIQNEGFTVAMTGDGVNDAPALAQADVGIAIGAGSDVAVETADVILIKNNPNDVAAVIELSRSTYKKMIQNLWWAAGYNIIAIPLAAGVLYKLGILLSPALGAVLMSASTVIVAINARLLKINRN